MSISRQPVSSTPNSESTLKSIEHELMSSKTARIEDENRNGENEVGTWVDEDE